MGLNKAFLSICLLALALPVIANNTGSISVPFGSMGESWKKYRDQSVSGQRVVEYVPKGQSHKKWNEMLIVDLVSKKMLPNDYNLAKFMDISLDQVKAVCRKVGGKFTSNVYKKTPDTIIVEWKAKGCGKTVSDRQVISRMTQFEDRLLAVEYSSINVITTERKKQIIKLISETTGRLP